MYCKKYVRASIPFPLYLRQIRRRNLPIPQLLPIHLPEPCMRKNIPSAVMQISVTLRRVALHELENEIGGWGAEGRPADETRPSSNFFVEDGVVTIGVMIGWETRKHFEDEDAKCVPIYTFIITMLTNDLRVCVSSIVAIKHENAYLGRKIVWGAAECPGRRSTGLRKPKVGHFYVPIKIEQDIFGFEVTIDDIERMQMVESQCNLCSVELCHRLRKSLRDQIRQ